MLCVCGHSASSPATRIYSVILTFLLAMVYTSNAHRAVIPVRVLVEANRQPYFEGNTTNTHARVFPRRKTGIRSHLVCLNLNVFQPPPPPKSNCGLSASFYGKHREPHVGCSIALSPEYHCDLPSAVVVQQHSSLIYRPLTISKKATVLQRANQRITGLAIHIRAAQVFLC